MSDEQMKNEASAIRAYDRRTSYFLKGLLALGGALLLLLGYALWSIRRVAGPAADPAQVGVNALGVVCVTVLLYAVVQTLGRLIDKH